MVTEAAIHAVHELTVCQRRTIAVRRTVGEQTGFCVIWMPEPVCDAAKAEVGSRLKIVTSASNNDKIFVRIVFKVIPPFL